MSAMASGDQGSDGPRCPDVEYADDKKDPDNYVKVCVRIPGLEKKLFGGGPSNAEITFKAEERSFQLSVKVKTKGKTEHFAYNIKMLPEPISTDEKKTHYKVNKGEVVLMLHKVHSGLWARHLSATGLETMME